MFPVGLHTDLRSIQMYTSHLCQLIGSNVVCMHEVRTSQSTPPKVDLAVLQAVPLLCNAQGESW